MRNETSLKTHVPKRKWRQLFSCKLSKGNLWISSVPSFDFGLCFFSVLLGLIGTITVFSAGGAYAAFRYNDASFFIRKQTVFFLLGLACMWAISHIHPNVWEQLCGMLYGVVLFLLLMVLIIGFTGNGAQRWIQIGPISIQPSEIGKTVLILLLAKYYSVFDEYAHSKNKRFSFWYGTVFPGILMLSFVILVMLQKHLSCIIILALIGVCLMVASGIRLKYLSVFCGIGILGISALAVFTDYTKERITVWLDPEKYRLTGGWQTLQGLMAIGSGGLFGVGIGNSALKHCYISEPANDMIFTVLCEETGYIGAVSVLLLFFFLCQRGFSIAMRAPTTFTKLTAFGLTAKCAIQTLLNIAVVTNSIPNTGISLPFFSYGGSSLLMLYAEIGILLSISRFSKNK